MTTTSPGAAARRVGVPAAAPALPAIHDRCQRTDCQHLASMHDIGTRRGLKVRTACANGTCNCRNYQPKGES